MNSKFKLSLVFVVLLGAVLAVSAAKKPEVRSVYMFGFAASLTDSTAYQTEVQKIDSAWIDPTHKFLMDRALYSLQLQYYMETDMHRKNTVCTVFFDQNPRKLQRKWAKVNKRYLKDTTLDYQILPKDRFAFKAEKYVEPTIGEEVYMPDSTQKAAPPVDKKPKKAPKK